MLCSVHSWARAARLAQKRKHTRVNAEKEASAVPSAALFYADHGALRILRCLRPRCSFSHLLCCRPIPEPTSRFPGQAHPTRRISQSLACPSSRWHWHTHHIPGRYSRRRPCHRWQTR
eukprot:scaffold1016_cov258-Pinguiococcus_pyrenoidosus.AAC.17